MRFLKMLLVTAAMGVAGEVAGSASAAVIDVTFTGAFDTRYNGCSPMSPLVNGNCGSSAISSPFSGSFSYSTDPGYTILGGSVRSDALALIGYPTSLTSTGSYGSVYTSNTNELVFNNILGSQRFVDFATLTVRPIDSVAANPASPLPRSAASTATFSFISSGSPGGTGPRLAGFVSNYAAIERVSAVPEPATWATMLLGVGIAGAALRRRRGVTARVRFV